MKKHLFTLAAVALMLMSACNEKPANATETAQQAAVENVVADQLKPTGDMEKDAKTCVNRMMKIVEETDFTDEASQQRIEVEFMALTDAFDNYYKSQGEEVEKQWNEIGAKVAQEAGLEELMKKKVTEAVTKALTEQASKASQEGK